MKFGVFRWTKEVRAGKEKDQFDFGFVEMVMEYLNEDNWICGSGDQEKCLD